MSRLELLMGLLCCLPLAACLRCYSCVFPAISPLDCLEFPLECPAGQRCLSSEASGHQGPIYLTIYEKSCANPSQCGRSGQKYSAGVVFNYTNDCCDTDLCNGAGPAAAALAWGVWLLAAVALLLP
ncbi:prostate stem cell antigen-like [Oryzias latipes]|uniref:prostate stem cell antigen-like n=1 Tax=Oryzias latipes TaxID=8090 RepID=UPI0005CC2B87|nr:prostate stem cell antigen-like [Oryzias latipes]